MHIDTSGSLFDTINNIISATVTIISLLGVVAYWIFSAIKNHRKKGFARGAYLSFIMFIFLLLPVFGFIILPETLAQKASQNEFTSYMTVGVLRWFAIYAVLSPLTLIVTYKFSKYKSTITLCSHLTVLLLGWLLGEWFGIIFISLPILTLLYFLLFHLAQVIFPLSVPENSEAGKEQAEREEKHNKFWALFWYIWGAQYPFWVAQSSASRDFEERIEGDYFKEFGSPGIVWMHSHQVAGQSVGIEFNYVNGPGIVFVQQYERPVALVDLRTQLRPVGLQAVTKDGISINAFMFASFKIDDENWDELKKEGRHRIWRISPILQNGLTIDRENGSYPYSTARVHAALSTTSVGAVTEDNTTPNIYWDEIVVQRIIKEARLVLSERTFDELWAPKKDKRGASALDEIANNIKEKASPRLQEIGVKLFASRIVNFTLEEDDPLRKQLTTTWIAAWEQKINRIKLDGDTEAEKLRLQARTAARATFLASITESLAKARSVDNDLPKQIVALNFISTLENLLQDTNSEDAEQQFARLEAWKQFVMRNSRGTE